MAGELLELVVGTDPTLKDRVVSRIQTTIAASFKEDKSRMTGDEVKRRFAILEKMIREFRSEHGWAFDRILDAMPFYLRCQLDRIPWEPHLDRNSWS